MAAKIVVVGSSNIDMVVKTAKIPHGGETVLGESFDMVPGGKGANQAVCAAKLGASVTLVARIGSDVFGDVSLKNFQDNGVDTTFVSRDASIPSGVAIIAVDANAENAIVVAPGANNALTPADVDSAKDAIAAADAVIVQFEIPMETVLHTIDIAHSLGVKVIVNPAPMRPFPLDALKKIDLLVPNQHEAAQLLGKAEGGTQLDAESAASELMALGVKAVAITLGSKGAYVADGTISEYIEPIKVEAVDTTAAGDAFTASLACGLAEGLGIADAARFAARVAAISVTRMGAQSSLPTRDEVDNWK